MIFMVACKSNGVGMHHHRRMQAREGSALQHGLIFPLASPTSSAGVPNRVMVTSIPSATLAAAIPTPADCRNQVVAAGVADAGQAVVLGANADVQRPRLPARAMNAEAARRAFFHCESPLRQRLRKASVTRAPLRIPTRV